MTAQPSSPPEWKSTACILCECNCGIEVQLGGEDGRHFTRIRGDKKHPLSRGYACEKANRLDFYQNGRDRITAPLRRRPDGSFEEIDWDTAIREVAGKLAAIRDEHGGDKIFYYGGGGQGNHLPGAYARSTLAALGNVYRSNALAQEKTVEYLEKDDVRKPIIERAVETVADRAEVAANTYYDRILDDLRNPHLSILDLVGFAVMAVGKLVFGV